METQLNQDLVERIRDTLSQALNLPLEQISVELSFGDLPQWDSLGHMEVMMRLEEHFGIEINADTIANLTSVAAIHDHIVNLSRRE